MSKGRAALAVALFACVVVGSLVAICAEPNAVKPEVAIRKAEAQTVLYTLYRGPYDKVGPAIGKLFMLAGQKGMAVRGPLAMIYLNNPQLVSSAHWLTELRIPVDKNALKLAGALGEFTDVKELPAFELAVVTKGEGVADLSPLMERLETWIRENGYTALEGPRETTLKGAETGDYAKMLSEIAIPLQKIAEHK